MIKIFYSLSLLIGGSILTMVIISVYFVYTVETWSNDCMLSYVEELKKDNNIVGHYYKTPYNTYHIDTKEYDSYNKIWIARGCLITPYEKKYIIETTFNSIYCYTTFLIK